MYIVICMSHVDKPCRYTEPVVIDPSLSLLRNSYPLLVHRHPKLSPDHCLDTYVNTVRLLLVLATTHSQRPGHLVAAGSVLVVVSFALSRRS